MKTYLISLTIFALLPCTIFAQVDNKVVRTVSRGGILHVAGAKAASRGDLPPVMVPLVKW